MGEQHPTPYSELNDVLRELEQGVQAILGDRFVGAYLQGSFAVGGFDEHSDADFIIVTEERLSDGHVTALQKMHLRIHALDRLWAKHLEGSYVPRDVLRDWRRAGTKLWYLDHGHRSLERAEHCNTVVVRWTLREHGIPFTGPEPSRLIDPIPVAELRREIRQTAIGWGREILADPRRWANRFYQSFIVLHHCRVLHDMKLGGVSSKPTAAEWAKRHLNPAWSGLIDRSWDGRPDPARAVREPADAQEYALTMEFVRFVVGACERYEIPR